MKRRLTGSLSRAAIPLTGDRGDYDALLALVGDARIVLLGEASQGTHEFYRERARITRRLIEEKRFTIVAAEADWPDADRVNRFVRGVGPDSTAIDELADFRRFPAWMWRNADVLDFVDWLREHDGRPAGRGRGLLWPRSLQSGRLDGGRPLARDVGGDCECLAARAATRLGQRDQRMLATGDDDH